MTILGFVQTNDGQIFELIDELTNCYDEYHARIFDQYYPSKYVRVLDRKIGGSGVYEIEKIKLIFRIK